VRKSFLGNSGLEVSEIAFGGVEIGMPYGIGVHSQEDMLSKKEAVLLLQSAVDQGINFFDTARMYGESEVIMGEAFKEMRQDLILATKCRHFRNNEGMLVPNELLPDFINSSLEQSLKALQTDYIDLFMLHQADVEILSNPIIAGVFQDLKKAGKIRATGVSTYALEESTLAIENGTWNVIQLPFNLLDQTQAQCFESAAQHGVGVVVRSVLMKGLLSDKGKNLHPALLEVEKHIEKYKEIKQSNTPDLPTLATQFVLSFPEVASVLIGIDKMEYLASACQTVGYGKLNNRVLEQAKQLAYPDPSFLNLPYWDKMGWLT
jgi:aryl-alcohol dehydrogenase-like predicted oxidoreductase